MRARMLRIVIAPFILCGLLGAAVAQESKTSATARRAEIINVVNTFVSAWNSADIDKLVGLFTEDGNFLSPTGADARSRPEIRNLLAKEHQELFTGTTLSANPNNVRFPAPGQAVARGSYTLKGVSVFLGFETAVNGPFTFQLARKEGRWLITTARIAKE